MNTSGDPNPLTCGFFKCLIFEQITCATIIRASELFPLSLSSDSDLEMPIRTYMKIFARDHAQWVVKVIPYPSVVSITGGGGMTMGLARRSIGGGGNTVSVSLPFPPFSTCSRNLRVSSIISCKERFVESPQILFAPGWSLRSSCGL